MKGSLLPDVVIRLKCTAVLELLANENQVFVVEGQYGVDTVSILESERIRPSLSCLPTKKIEMKGRLLPDVVIREGTTILELLAEVLEVKGLQDVEIRKGTTILKLFADAKNVLEVKELRDEGRLRVLP